MNTPNINKRLRYTIIGSIIVLISMVSYLFHLQINLQNRYFNLGQKNFQLHEKISSPRGNITDSLGNLLATNIPTDSVLWQGTGNKTLTDEQISNLNKLKDILTLSDDIESKVSTTEKKTGKLCIAKNINFEQLSEITELFSNNKNVIISRDFKRYYPHKSIASHIIGYLGTGSEIQGKTGLESLCNNILQGQYGQIIKTINSIGCNIETVQTKKALIGNSIKTTLNLPVQMLLENKFPKENAGAAILFDPQTGAIEAMLSRPNFDSNIFLDRINTSTWNTLQEKQCFLNRALSACYPPGSLFKLITISAAMEEGLIDSSSTWNCSGRIYFGNRFYYCNKMNGHGVVNTEDALVHSCNIPFYEIGKKINIDKLAEYANKLGLGQHTNIIFSENTGLIPTNSWKYNTKGESWWLGETLSSCIGQSYVLITPIQAARTISAICTGYLLKPRILSDEPIIYEKLDIKDTTINLLKKSMRSVTTIGTARILQNLKDFKIYAKTGTAQTRNLHKKRSEKAHFAHAWFASYFQYKNYPPKTLVILIENTGRTRPAIAMAEEFFKEYKKYIEKNRNLNI